MSLILGLIALSESVTRYGFSQNSYFILLIGFGMYAASALGIIYFSLKLGCLMTGLAFSPVLTCGLLGFGIALTTTLLTTALMNRLESQEALNQLAPAPQR